MTMTTRSGLFLCVVLSLTAPGPATAQNMASARANCEALADLRLSNGAIAAAEFVEAGAFMPPGGSGDDFSRLDAFCRVTATLSPVAGSEIGIELWMPADDWNNKLVAVGNGGLAGSIRYGALAESLAAGYSAVSTDTGHRGREPEFLLNPVQLVDFAHRAVHEMTVVAKGLIPAYYPSTLSRTYFDGCSTGGRQALTAAQRYPRDFDGIIAGAPANSTLRMTTQQLWTGLVVSEAPEAALSARELEALNRRVIESCDELDGVEDAVIENPAACEVGPAILGTLSPAQQQAVNRIYDGPVNPESGASIFPGLARGSEAGWTAMASSEPFGYAYSIQSHVIHQDPQWDHATLDLSRALSPLDQRLNAVGMQAINAELTPYIENGGKLLMYHGWNDPLISPYNSVNYYREVLRVTGPEAADSVRLFMMPGVNHCRGGNGTDSWDRLAELDAWIESGETPQRIEAARMSDGEADRTRPLCAYPRQAVYDGSGDINNAANFECRVPD